MMSMIDDQARDDVPAADMAVPDRQAGDAFTDDGAVLPAGGHGVLAGVAAIQGEMLSLVGTRWGEVLQMPGLLLECRGDPARAIAVQIGFAERAGAHYLEAAYRLMALAGHRLTKDGVIVIVAQEHRDQSRNRAEARERLFDLIRQAAVRPTVRRKTRVPKSAKRERLESKKRRSGIKNLRQRKPGID